MSRRAALGFQFAMVTPNTWGLWHLKHSEPWTISVSRKIGRLLPHPQVLRGAGHVGTAAHCPPPAVPATCSPIACGSWEASSSRRRRPSERMSPRSPITPACGWRRGVPQPLTHDVAFSPGAPQPLGPAAVTVCRHLSEIFVMAPGFTPVSRPPPETVSCRSWLA